jgi:hypothetical protein
MPSNLAGSSSRGVREVPDSRLALAVQANEPLGTMRRVMPAVYSMLSGRGVNAEIAGFVGAKSVGASVFSTLPESNARREPLTG